MVVELYKSNILDNNLFEVNGALVDTYNASLEKLTGKKTELKEFHVDKRGVSPEIKHELGEYYLQNGFSNRYAIIVSPEQAASDLVQEDFSFDNKIIDGMYKRNMESIALITQKSSLYSRIDDHTSTHHDLEDLLLIKNITMRLGTDNGFIKNAKELNKMIQELEKNPDLLVKNDAFHIKKIHELAGKVGDVRGYDFTNMEYSTEITSFSTDFFNGVYLLKNQRFGSSIFGKSKKRKGQNDHVTMIYHPNQEQTPEDGPKVDFIKVDNGKDILSFLTKNKLVSYSEDTIRFMLKRIEDLDLVKKGYVPTRMSEAEKEKVLHKFRRTADWKMLKDIKKAVHKGHDLEDVIEDTKRMSTNLKLSLVDINEDLVSPDTYQTLSSLLSEVSIGDYEGMFQWNRKQLHETLKQGSSELQEYIVSTLNNELNKMEKTER